MDSSITTMPTSVRIDASTICQLRCVTCPSHDPKNKWVIGKGHLKYSDFKKFIDNHDYIRSVELSNYGEMFMNPELIDIMEYAYKRNVKLTAESGVNFNTASDDVIEALVKYRFSSMGVAIDGASQETYAKYRVRGNYQRVIENIEKLNKYKKIYKSKLPKLIWKYVIMHNNENDVVSAKEKAQQLNMRIKFKLTWDPTYEPKNIEMLKAETGLAALTRDEYNKTNSKRYLSHICNMIWETPQINWDGRLLGCCIAARKDFGVNVFEVGLEEALNTLSYKYAKQLLQGNITSDDVTDVADNIPCLTCKHYKKMVKRDSFLVIN